MISKWYIRYYGGDHVSKDLETHLFWKREESHYFKKSFTIWHTTNQILLKWLKGFCHYQKKEVKGQPDCRSRTERADPRRPNRSPATIGRTDDRVSTEARWPNRRRAPAEAWWPNQCQTAKPTLSTYRGLMAESTSDGRTDAERLSRLDGRIDVRRSSRRRAPAEARWDNH